MAKKTPISSGETSESSSKKRSRNAVRSGTSNPILPALFIAAVFLGVTSLILHTPSPSEVCQSSSSLKTVTDKIFSKKEKPYKAHSPGYNMPEIDSLPRRINAIVSGSFIYWKPVQDEFSIGITGPRPNIEQKVKEFKSHYQPGFKAGLGFNSSYDSWALFLE